MVPNATGIIGFFLLALVSWLSARSLDQALNELRAINANLDRVVTERTQALAESLERERIEAGRNQAILNSIADGVVVFDTKWNAILANPALRSILDLPIEMIVNKNFRDLIEHPRLAPKSRTLLYSMLEHDTQPPSFRVEWGDKTLSISAAQVYYHAPDGNTNIGTVTVFRDFTREAEVEKLKSTFVAIVSHELRTPLNAILGYAEMFKESVYGPMNEKQINMAERIMKNTQRLLKMINDLLDQAQILSIMQSNSQIMATSMSDCFVPMKIGGASKYPTRDKESLNPKFPIFSTRFVRWMLLPHVSTRELDWVYPSSNN
jgi:signal transduction histidine kinase